jgi:hypothetical protein
VAEFEEAQWGIPHCKYEKTPEGFKVNYVTPRKFNPAMIALGSVAGLVLAVLSIAFGIAAGANTDSVLVGFLVFFGLLGGGFYFTIRKIVGRIHTSIEVTRNAVIIDNKKLRREDFGSFNIGHTVNLPGTATTLGQSSAVLGYRYGSQNFEFGGTWLKSQAEEFVSSLNKKIRRTAAEGDESSPSPEALRAARPTDF